MVSGIQNSGKMTSAIFEFRILVMYPKITCFQVKCNVRDLCYILGTYISTLHYFEEVSKTPCRIEIETFDLKKEFISFKSIFGAYSSAKLNVNKSEFENHRKSWTTSSWLKKNLAIEQTTGKQTVKSELDFFLSHYEYFMTIHCESQDQWADSVHVSIL